MQVNINGETRLSLSDRLSRSTAISAIGFYQRYISPYKGFRCAHRVLHSESSCSAYAKVMVQRQGLREAIPAIRQRFRDCGEAARVLRLQSGSRAAGPREGRERQSSWLGCVPDCSGACLPDLSGGCDCGDIDLGGCDGLGCDAVGCDGMGCDL